MPDIEGTRIHITGIVQGVGFRPFVYGLAVAYGLTGWVRNSSAGVDIEVDGTGEQIRSFVQDLRSKLPMLARIDSLTTTPHGAAGFSSFDIVPSEVISGGFQPISPDVSICADCLDDIFNPTNRRYHYPFTNCTNCGPRFTIIKDIPYDRRNTTMASFNMCSDCEAEYTNPLDRRFHAQPVACPVCGPQLWLEDIGGKRLAEKEGALLLTQKLLLEGKIIAIKGIGGFHLACDATNSAAVSELRKRKLRVDKPFAVMMADVGQVEQYCSVSGEERKTLEAYTRPIVLLESKPDTDIAKETAPSQHSLGVMLPYTPLQYLLFSDLGSDSAAFVLPPLVMTSGNLSEEPIATENDEARLRLSSLADALLLNNRDIYIRCDDSVVRVLPVLIQESSGRSNTFDKPASRLYFLRRSRGYAPDAIRLPFEVPPILATGPELKNTFCLTRENYAFLSQHIGDMENYETLHSFEEGIEHYERLFHVHPQAIAFDIHPDYLSTRYALQRAQRENLPAFGVQHHHAHVAACMADNGLDGSHPVIGLAFDGTGFGKDEKIWGGEALLADYKDFQRCFHLAYFPLPGGEAAIKRPARTALALLWSLGMDWEDSLAPAQELCFEERQALRIQLEHKLNSPLTSSLGRLFDAAAALAGGRQKVNYEAQAAIEFEAVIDPTEEKAYNFVLQGETIQVEECFRSLIKDVLQGISLPVISARFHNGVADLCRNICATVSKRTGIREVALSGGIWQNMVLLEKTLRLLNREGFIIYTHKQVPTNDGGLSLGQALVGAAKFQ